MRQKAKIRSVSNTFLIQQKLLRHHLPLPSPFLPLLLHLLPHFLRSHLIQCRLDMRPRLIPRISRLSLFSHLHWSHIRTLNLHLRLWKWSLHFVQAFPLHILSPKIRPCSVHNLSEDCHGLKSSILTRKVLIQAISRIMAYILPLCFPQNRSRQCISFRKDMQVE
jgi:hypothetical protein